MLTRITQCVEQARRLVGPDATVEFSAEDATRTEHECSLFFLGALYLQGTGRVLPEGWGDGADGSHREGKAHRRFHWIGSSDAGMGNA